MEHQLKFGNSVINYNLQYQERKSLGIKVYPEGAVQILCPVNAKHNDVILKLRQKAPWILKQIDQFNNYKPATPPRRFINGETHLYLGRQYRLKIVHDNENIVKAFRGQLFIHGVNTKTDTLRQLLRNWYKKKANVVFHELLQEVLPKFNRYKIEKPSLSIRSMTKRWGSCTPGGKIVLNTELIKAPKGSIEYIIVHELCHLIYYNHNKSFQNLQSKIMPDWKKWKDRLEYFLS